MGNTAPMRSTCTAGRSTDGPLEAVRIRAAETSGCARLMSLWTVAIGAAKETGQRRHQAPGRALCGKQIAELERRIGPFHSDVT